MELVHRTIAHRDERGVIVDVLLDYSVEHVATFSSKKGAVRGNHYHKESVAFIFVLVGKLQYSYRMVGETEVKVIEVGNKDLLRIDPLEVHTVTALEDSVFLMLTHGPKGGRQFEGDTVREQL